MNATPISSTKESQIKVRALPNAGRFFYAGAAAFLVVLMFWGFQLFYLQGRAYPGRPIAPPIRALAIQHAIAMTTWMLLVLAQSLLIAGGKRRVHMTLGKIGVVIASLVVILGFRLAVESTRINPPEMRIWGLSSKQFMAVPVFSVIIFAGFVAAGILSRHRPEIHRPMMLLATLIAISAGVSRIGIINGLYDATVWERMFGPFLGTLFIAVIFLVVKSFLTRSVDRYYAWGCAGLIVSCALIMQVARTGVWDVVASVLLR